MGEPRFTKGGWRVGVDETRTHGYLWSLHVFAGDAHFQIAWCSAHGDDCQDNTEENAPGLDEARANAALIASAPALYEALYHARNLLHALTGADDAISAATLDAANAALSLANPSPTDRGV